MSQLPKLLSKISDTFRNTEFSEAAKLTELHKTAVNHTLEFAKYCLNPDTPKNKPIELLYQFFLIEKEFKI
jgi:hypothetical protein